MKKILKKYLVHFSLSAWLVGLSIPMIYFHAWHSAALPEVQLKQDFLKTQISEDSWEMVHFVDQSCLCSNFVANHLVARASDKSLNEMVYMLGDSEEVFNALKDKGYKVQKIHGEFLVEKFGITGVPAFAIFSPGKKLKYFGGYNERSINKFSKIKDLEILELVRQGKDVSKLPQFGCANSKALQAKLDPLRLKYEEGVK